MVVSQREATIWLRLALSGLRSERFSGYIPDTVEKIV